MATPQPQPQPQQPIYVNELNSALDRQYSRLVNYVDARIDALTTQMRVFREESITRDIELRDGMRSLADAILKLGQQVGTLEKRVTNLENRMTNLENRMTKIETAQQETLQVIRDLHAQTMEAINDLRPKDIE